MATAIFFIENYIRNVKTQFGKISKIIESDNEYEYVNKKVKKLFVNEGIRAQQNAKTTLLEVGRFKIN